MVTLYLVDQYGVRRAWAQGVNGDDAREMLEQDRRLYAIRRPDLKLHIETGREEVACQ